MGGPQHLDNGCVVRKHVMLKDYRTYNRGDTKVARTVIIHLYSDPLIINRASER